MSVSTTAPSPLSRQTLLDIAKTLPADLRVLSKLGQILQDPNSDLEEIVSLLRRDVTLAAKIVRVSNSAMFSGGRTVSSVEEAVNNVGFGEVLKLLGTATAGRLSESSLMCYDLQAKLLCDNMLYGAFAAEALAPRAGLDPKVAYSAGLLRAVGIMVLDRAGRRGAVASPLYSPSRWPNFRDWEVEVFGITSCEVTALLLEEWEFPRELTGAIRCHYITKPDDKDQPLAALLNLANGLAQRVSRSFRGEDPWWAITTEKMKALNLTEDDFEPAVITTEEAFEAATAALAA
jgi:HD-like signal output (HDOD) protein